MGAKDWFVLYSDPGVDVASVLAGGAALDRDATDDLVRRLFPDHTVTPTEDRSLGGGLNPGDDEVLAAVWPGAAIVCTAEAAVDLPSQLDPRFLREGAGRVVRSHAMHSVVDWSAYGVWDPNGRLVRALSVNGDDQVIEEVGERPAFEAPFWAGEHRATEYDDYPLPFHPLELGEAALHSQFGFVLEGYSGMDLEGLVDVDDVPLVRYRLKAPPRRGWFRRR